MQQNALQVSTEATPKRIAPCLWFDHQAEEATRLYTSVFRNSRITHVSRYGEAGREIHGREPGSIMAVAFELDGQPFTALNAGAAFAFSEAISFQIRCETQEQVDHYWTRLSDGGDEAAQACGWLKDRYGVSWQVVPIVLEEMLRDEDAARVERVTKAMLPMKKLDIDELSRAYIG